MGRYGWAGMARFTLFLRLVEGVGKEFCREMMFPKHHATAPGKELFITYTSPLSSSWALAR
jgi:hypothetical protein